MLTRAELKQRAKDSMSAASTHPVIVALLFYLITLAISGVSGLVFGIFSTITSFGFLTGTMSDTMSIYASIMIWLFSIIFTIFVSMASAFLMVGFSSYSLKTIRHQEAGIESLFQYFKYFVKSFCLLFMIQLFTTLWSLLFFFPGIMAMISYQQAVYIFIDDPSKGVMQCIRESKSMMAGHKWEFFVLMLSFILWLFVVGISCGLAAIYVYPYMQLTYSVYYDNLKYISTPPPYQQVDQPAMQ